MKGESRESVVERFRSLKIEPDPRSATQFAPFYDVPAADFEALLAVVEAAQHLATAYENDYYPDKHGMLVQDLIAALATLTTEQKPGSGVRPSG